MSAWSEWNKHGLYADPSHKSYALAMYLAGLAVESMLREIRDSERDILLHFHQIKGNEWV